jgi:xylan 1,4-beta-xylosidase
MNDIQATGHADFFEDHHGQWWVVFLGIRYATHGYHNLGRETFLAPVEWTEDGWPIVNHGQKILETFEVDRDIPSHPWPTSPIRASCLRSA